MILMMVNKFRNISLLERIRIRVALLIFPDRILRLIRQGDIKVHIIDSEQTLRGNRVNIVYNDYDLI